MSWLQKMFPPPPPATTSAPAHVDAFAAAKTALDAKVESVQVNIPGADEIFGSIVSGMRNVGSGASKKRKATKQ